MDLEKKDSNSMIIKHQNTVLQNFSKHFALSECKI